MIAAASDRYVAPGLARGLRLLELFDRARLVAEVGGPVRETARDISRSLGWRATTAAGGAASGHG